MRPQAKVFSEGLRVAAELGAKITRDHVPGSQGRDRRLVSALRHRGGGRARGDLSLAQGRIWPRACGTTRSRPCSSPAPTIRRSCCGAKRFAARCGCCSKSVDLIAVPAQAFAAPTLAKMAALGEDASLIAGLLRFTCPFDMTGSPTITLPAGFAPNGGPVAFQFVGRHFDEAASRPRRRCVPARHRLAHASSRSLIPRSRSHGRRLVEEFHHGKAGRRQGRGWRDATV